MNKTRDGHINGVTGRLYRTDFSEYEQFKKSAAEDAASAPVSQFKATTTSGKVYEFKARTDLGEKYLKQMANRAVMSYETVSTIEEVR